MQELHVNIKFKDLHLIKWMTSQWPLRIWSIISHNNSKLKVYSHLRQQPEKQFLINPPALSLMVNKMKARLCLILIREDKGMMKKWNQVMNCRLQCQICRKDRVWEIFQVNKEKTKWYLVGWTGIEKTHLKVENQASQEKARKSGKRTRN